VQLGRDPRFSRDHLKCQDIGRLDVQAIRMPVIDSEIFLVLLIANQLCDVRANGRFDKIGAIFFIPRPLSDSLQDIL